MSDTPESLGEVARLLKAMQTRNDERFDALDRRLDKLVSTEIHSMYVQTFDRRINDLIKALGDEREARAQAVADEKRDRKAAIAEEEAERKKADDKAGVWVRSLLIGLVIPIVLWLGTIVMAASAGE